MCYSTQSSLIAWVFSVVIGCYLWYRNRKYDRWNASFIWTFSAVQLWEAGIWSTDDKDIQELYLKLIVLTLAAQPLVQTFAAWKATGSKHQLLKIMSGVYLAIWLYTLYRTFTAHFYASVGPNGHLVWNASSSADLRDASASQEPRTGSLAERPPSLAGAEPRIGMISGIPILGLLYFGGMFLGLLYGLPNTLVLIAVGVATLLWSLSQVTTKEFGSYWCYTAVAYSIAALFV